MSINRWLRCFAWISAIVIGATHGLILPASGQLTVAGRAMLFNGTNQRVTTSLSVSNDFTIEFWFNSGQISGSEANWYNGMGLVDAEVAGFTDDFGVSLGNGKVLFGTGNPDTTIRSGILADNSWHHVAATRVQSSGAMLLYIDGVVAASGTGSKSPLAASKQISIGSLQTSLNFYKGLIDELRIWNRARTASDILQNKNRLLTGREPNLVTYFRFDDASFGNMMANIVPNSDSGLLVNNPLFEVSFAPIGTITNLADSGPGSLRQAILDAKPGEPINITVTGTITLQSPLPLITTRMTINGPGADKLTISGNNLFRVFFVDTTDGVYLQNLTIANGRAKGGNGGTRAGGGAGLGGGLFVNSGTVIVSGVVFKGCSAIGGNGGGSTVITFGGGGGLGGDGGNAYGTGGGGGGGFYGLGGAGVVAGGGGGGFSGKGGTSAGDPATSGRSPGGGGGGKDLDGGTATDELSTTGAPGYGGGGSGGGYAVDQQAFPGSPGMLYGGGGGGGFRRSYNLTVHADGGKGGRFGGGGGAGFNGKGGDGGEFGGGGGSSSDAANFPQAGPAGGFGGGGGSGHYRAFYLPGGPGGFGGGGGAGPGLAGEDRRGPGGPFGGNGGIGANTGGGGGAGLGASVFVRSDNRANLSWIDSSTDEGTVTGGAVGRGGIYDWKPGESGRAAGSSIFLSGGIHFFSVTTGTQAIRGDIAGWSASPASLFKNGLGRLILSASNSYTGFTTVNQGTLEINGSIGGTGITVSPQCTLTGIGKVGPLSLYGTLAPGVGPGMLKAENTIWSGAGSYEWQLYDATNAPGSGYDVLQIKGTLDLSGAQGFNIIISTLSSAQPPINGDAIHLQNSQRHSWVLVQTTEGIRGFRPGSGQFNISTSQFTNPRGSNKFSLIVFGNDLILEYLPADQPAPTPSQLGAGALSVLDEHFSKNLDHKLVVSGVPVPILPEFIAQHASQLTGTSATFNALVDPHDEITEIYFQYGLSTNYGSFSPTNTLWGAEQPLSSSSDISGLAPAVTYHFQTVAHSILGVIYGGDSTFTTPPLAAVSDVVWRPDDEALTLSASDLLNNDLALTGTLTVTDVSPHSAFGGAVALINGQIIYTPLENPVADSFTYTISDSTGRTATGTVLVRIAPITDTSRPVVLNLVGEPGSFSLYSFGVPGKAYRLQYAPDLNGEWTDLETVTADEEGFFWSTNLVDQFDPAFYRTVWP